MPRMTINVFRMSRHGPMPYNKYEFEIKEGSEISIGRGHSDIELDHHSISRKHGAFIVRNGRLFYRDNSTIGSNVAYSVEGQVKSKFLRNEEEFMLPDGWIILSPQLNSGFLLQPEYAP